MIEFTTSCSRALTRTEQSSNDIQEDMQQDDPLCLLKLLPSVVILAKCYATFPSIFFQSS